MENHRELIDAAYAINENLDEALSPDGRPLYMGLQAAEKLSQNYTLSTTNVGGHSSRPRRDNAIYQLARALDRLDAYTIPVALNDVSRGYFTETAKVETPAVAAAMRAIVANPGDSAAAATLADNVNYRSTLRTTCVATRLGGGHAYNALPQAASANVNCRIVPTSSVDEVRQALQRIVADTGVRVSFTIAPGAPSPAPTPIDPALLAATADLTHATWGAAVPVIPTMAIWATDGRYLRAGGIASYGLSGMFLVPNEDNSHGRDERMRVRSFYEGVDFLDRLVRRVAGSPAA
jgi:acetylornithine deacetylase/succinyl-diaminopimelate desuccinylase-like protein